jgi:arsenite methyltransferase
VLDVGAGDGLIGFGAIDLVGPAGKVIFSDVSADLLEVCRTQSRTMGLQDRCEFVRASAEELAAIPDSSVDVVTTRSVLIYVQDKQRAFDEFHRVLRPSGRFSIFEPINGYFPTSPDLLWNYDVAPVARLAGKIREVYERAQPPDTDPMKNFDERDLLTFAQRARFEDLHLDLQVQIAPGAWWGSWDALLKSSPNPLAPTLARAMAEALTQEEAEEFEAHLRPLVDQSLGLRRDARAYLWGRKAS